MAAVATKVSLEEYLQTSYRPDIEYIDGVLKEKPMPTALHGIVQFLLGHWFLLHSEQWNVTTAGETRTKVSERHVRLPDVVVISFGEGSRGVLIKPPLIVIEILLPSDTYADLQQRASDFWVMDTRNIWLLDPERRTAEVWTGKHWQSHETLRLTVLDGAVYLDLDWLWEKADKQLKIAEG